MSLSAWSGRPEQPGLIPLRPLSTSELIGFGLTVVRRTFLPLGSIALLLSVVGSVATWGILTATDSLQAYLDASWVDEALTGGTATLPPTGVLLATFVQAAFGAAALVLLSGVSSVAVSRQVLGAPVTAQEWRARLGGGRWRVLLGVTVVAAVGMTAGLALLVVPGVLLYLAWLVAGPSLVMERAGVVTALRRSVRLTRGHRGRLFGLVVLLGVIQFGVTFAVSLLIAPVLTSASDVTALLASDVVSALTATLTWSWVGATSALAYVDLRIRSEDLGPTLAAAARA